MSNMRDFFGLSDAADSEADLVPSRQKASKATLLSVHALRNAAARLADLRADGASLNTREFVGLLLCNAQRSRRISLPQAAVRIATYDAKGRTAIRLSLG